MHNAKAALVLVVMISIAALCVGAGISPAGPPASSQAAVEGVSFSPSAKAVDCYDFIEVVIRVAQPPEANPFTQASGTATAPYSASLFTNAVTPTGDMLSFAKVSGPAWLSVATDGTLSGTPAVADIGANVFVVSLADTNGWASSASMVFSPKGTASQTKSGSLSVA